MSATAEQREFAGKLIEEVCRTFFYCYYAHANGESLQELLIDYDIQAAFNNVDTHLADTIRKTIKAACKAYDERIPFTTAQEYLNTKMHHHVDVLLNSDAHSISDQFVRDSIKHALD